MPNTHRYGYAQIDRLVFRDTFTGDGSTKTFQLATPDNATFTIGSWTASNILNTLPAHVTKTNKKPIYDSLIPLSRNRIGVSSISTTTGIITLDYAPRNNAQFYVFYWYELDGSEFVEDYYREEFVASMEAETLTKFQLDDLDTSNKLQLIWNEDDTSDRTLNLLVGGGNRSIDFKGYEQMQEPNGFPNRTDSTLSWSVAASVGTLTIAPSGSSFDFYETGTRYNKTSSENINISSTSGLHVIHYSSGSLTDQVNPSHAQLDTLITTKALVALIYWNDTDKTGYLVADERHGIKMASDTHHYLHDTRGASWFSGLAVSGYTLATKSDAALTFEVTNGIFYDEDIDLSIEHAATATGQYNQILNSVDAEIPVMYRDDTDGSWKEQAASTLPYISAAGGSNRLARMNDDGDGTWSQVEIANTKFMSYFLVATNDWQYPIKMIQGSVEYASIVAAAEGVGTEVIAWGTFPSPEIVILYQFIMQTGTGYGGTKKAQIVDVTDFRTVGLTGGGAAGAVTDHGSLSGLSDNDHPQYIAYAIALGG